MLRDKQGAEEDGAHSTDDEEVYKAARRIFNDHEEEIVGGRGLGDYMSDRERLDMTLDHLHEQRKYEDDEASDGDEDDLDEAVDEEIEDRLIDARQRMQRPLNLDEVARLSRQHNPDHQSNLSMSMLSGVMN